MFPATQFEIFNASVKKMPENRLAYSISIVQYLKGQGPTAEEIIISMVDAMESWPLSSNVAHGVTEESLPKLTTSTNHLARNIY
jgi:hypothetical protein